MLHCVALHCVALCCVLTNCERIMDPQATQHKDRLESYPCIECIALDQSDHRKKGTNMQTTGTILLKSSNIQIENTFCIMYWVNYINRGESNQHKKSGIPLVSFPVHVELCFLRIYEL